MLRWLACCVVLVIGCIALVALLAPRLPGETEKAPTRPVADKRGPGEVNNEGGKREEDRPSRGSGAEPVDRPPVLLEVAVGKAGGQALVIQEARVLSMEKQEVPSERDGKLICLATTIRPGEEVPEEKIIEVEVGFLAVDIGDGSGVPASEQFTLKNRPGRYFRKARDNEELPPERVVVAREKMQLRKLEVGDRVEKGQLLAIVNPELALDEMAIKVSKLDAAEADRRASYATREEAARRLAGIMKANNAARRAVSEDEVGQARLAVEKYKEEEISKASQVRVSQRELSAAVTTVKQHSVRAVVPGVVKVIYKNTGDAVKNLDAILQIQNPERLRVEGQVELQDAKYLRDRLDSARALGERGKLLVEESRRKGDAAGVARGQKMMADSAQQLQVIVEVSRPEPPRAVLKGHLQDVTCVAVSKGSRWVISGSEDNTVRLWERPDAKQPRWQERYRLDHRAVVRALACTGPDAKANLLLTGTANGFGRLFNLDDLKAPPGKLQGRHSGSITCVAFSPDASICATGGDDRAICLWETTTGKLLHRIGGAHKATVTSLQFASPTRLVSAGRDKRLAVWTVDGEKAPVLADELDRRSGDVSQLGVGPKGDRVMFDEGRELRVMSLDTRKIIGTLQNPVGTVNFSTMALFSPDGKTILTNGSAAGRLQLWRAPGDDVRASELRQYLWNSAPVTCGAFSPDSTFAVTGTQDHQVLIWEMPSKAEADNTVTAQLTYVDEFVDSSLKRVPVRAEMRKAPRWVIPGATATLVIPPQAGR